MAHVVEDTVVLLQPLFDFFRSGIFTNSQGDAETPQAQAADVVDGGGAALQPPGNQQSVADGSHGNHQPQQGQQLEPHRQAFEKVHGYERRNQKEQSLIIRV